MDDVVLQSLLLLWPSSNACVINNPDHTQMHRLRQYKVLNITKLYSIKSEFTCCPSSLARALVIGPILTSLGLSLAATSSIEENGKGLGMSSSEAEPGWPASQPAQAGFQAGPVAEVAGLRT